MKPDTDNDDERGASEPKRDAHWGYCAAYGCPLLGTVGRGGRWWCCCHAEAGVEANDAITHGIRRHQAVHAATLDVRGSAGSADWALAYRAAQQRLLDAGYAELLPDDRDASLLGASRTILPQWLARLERFLRDEALAAPQSAVRGATAPPTSRACVARMRARLAPLDRRAPSARWAFVLLDHLAARPHDIPASEPVRAALDAISSRAGRAVIAAATDAERMRWRAGLAAIGGKAANLLPSREPGEDDEPLTEESDDDESRG
ncbi:hypothetical protein BDI4_100049 [Burkholderia diffusa]|uniref:hypothetical protein n=1 Tax=Burkholderia diffusa TaxID=488732 RepID=UPI001CAEAEBA|nr:hypothetical protein [Burkholderia diffusa]CAG9241108.1 hypothetical protein BDI4_100049 [Burkholderia diffusa]